MIINEYNNFSFGLRDLFCNIVSEVFGNTESFLDFIENEEYSWNYNCYYDYSGENYIINRETGEYINWYKFSHIGRDINISVFTFLSIQETKKWLENFLIEFKNSGNKGDKNE